MFDRPRLAFEAVFIWAESLELLLILRKYAIIKAVTARKDHRMAANSPAQQTLPEDTKPFVIVGAGFAGTATALHFLLKAAEDPSLSADKPLKLTVLERYPQQMHGGIAYGRVPAFEYNLNLSSKRVTPFAAGKKPRDLPSFEEYIQERAKDDPPFADNLANPSRQVYGQYLHDLIDAAVARTGGKVVLERKYDEAVDLVDTPQGTTVHLKSGERLQAAHVMLATGFKEAVMPKFAFNAAAHPQFLDYPYSHRANTFFDKLLNGPNNAEDKTTLVLGTGLSAMDTVIRLLDGGYKGKITMLSRKAQFHPTYKTFLDKSYMEAGLQGEPRPPDTLPFTKKDPDFMGAVRGGTPPQRVFKEMLYEFRKRQREGYTSEEILSHWEKSVPELFARMPEETNKFLAINETLINLLRVGTTPEISEKVFAAMDGGQIDVIGGTVRNIHAGNKGFVIDYALNDRLGRPLPDGEVQTRRFDTLISGIGNSTKYDLPPAQIGDALWRRLREKEAFQGHVLRDGVAVEHDFTLKNGDGTAYRNVSAVGSHISGHMNVTAYPYPEKSGSGARLGAFTLNISGILGAAIAFTDMKYDDIRRKMQPAPQNGLQHKTAYRSPGVAPA